MTKERKSIHTTGEHNIDNIIRSNYGELTPEDHADKKKHLATLNPHIVSLESLKVGDQVFLEPDEEEEDTSLSTLDSGGFSSEDQSLGSEDQSLGSEDQDHKKGKGKKHGGISGLE
jgi:hypothetical protein